MTRLALHCLDSEARQAAQNDLSQMAPRDLLDRKPFRIEAQQINTLIKSNAFEIECPTEVFQFDLKVWPEKRVWSWLREQTCNHNVVAVPLKGKVLAIGLIDDVREIFGDNIKGEIQRTPVEPEEFRYEDGAIVSLMREALVNTMADTAGIKTDGRRELWLSQSVKTTQQGGMKCIAYESMLLFIRRIGNSQYLVLKPSIKVLDANGGQVPYQIANSIKLNILGWQHNKPFNQVMMKWRRKLFPYGGYSDENERFDVHDFVKAFCVQRGVATQFLNQDTLSGGQQCRIWWWLSLALYVKSMRTPWVLDNLSDDTAFVGLGFSIDRTASPHRHVILGCSHIYSARGEGLQYRLSKVENPIMRGRNPFMSKDDARRVGETIRELFYEAHSKLPSRVVLHKRTPFRGDEREGLLDGLGNVEQIDMLEIQTDNALRYVASQNRYGKIDEDNFPVQRGTAVQLDNYTALLWVHGATTAVNPRLKYFQGKRRIPAPLTIRRHVGQTDLKQICEEILGLSKMNWNTFDLYTKAPATLHSSNEIARIGSLLQRFGATSYDYRLFI